MSRRVHLRDCVAGESKLCFCTPLSNTAAASGYSARRAARPLGRDSSAERAGRGWCGGTRKALIADSSSARTAWMMRAWPSR